MVELRHLRYFVAVAEELHFARAAARLGIAQPPLSLQIRQLEESVGATLFRRTTRKVQLTEAGRRFLAGARRTLASADLAVEEARRAGRGELGRLALGFVGTATLPPILRRFRARYPEVELSFHQLTSAEQAAALVAGRIDVGFLRPPLDDERLAVETLLREPLVVALPADHALAGPGRVPLRALRDEDFVSYPRQAGSGLYDQTITACQAAGFSPCIVQEAVEMATVIGLVASGLGVALVPTSARRLRSADIAFRELTEPPSVELAIAWLRENPSPVLAVFLAIVREVRDDGAPGGDARDTTD